MKTKIFNEEFTFDFGNDSNQKNESVYKPIKSKKVEKESEELDDADDNNPDFDEDLIDQENDEDKNKSKTDSEILNKQGKQYFILF